MSERSPKQERKLESSTYLIPGSEVIARKCWKDFDGLGSSFRYPSIPNPRKKMFIYLKSQNSRREKNQGSWASADHNQAAPNGLACHSEQTDVGIVPIDLWNLSPHCGWRWCVCNCNLVLPLQGYHSFGFLEIFLQILRSNLEIQNQVSQARKPTTSALTWDQNI